MQTIDLGKIDVLILLVYFAFVIGIGWALKRYMKTSADFFLSGRSIPAWVTGLAFISANLGAVEVMGMAASGAQYGIMTSHFYWVGAIPAMVFLAIFMMPFYYGSRARSVPEFLKLRYDEKTRGFNAISFAVMTVLVSGISMHLFAVLLEQVLGWNYEACIVASALIVLAYIFLGGLTSAIYNEVLQFFMIVLGLAPLVFLALKDVGGWSKLKEKLIPVATSQGVAGGTWSESWSHMGSAIDNPMGVGWFGMVMGLGFVLSFAYWCTDFRVVQRAMAANSMSAARRTPLIAAVPKMLFPALVILPGMIAIALHFSQPSSNYFVPVNRELIYENIAAERLQILDPTNLTRDQQAGFAAEKKKVEAALKNSNKVDPAIKALVQKWETQLRSKPANLDYNKVIPSMLKHYLPMGLLGIGIAALMASFMSGMAGCVTAFNTVWTYDIYQSYIAPKKSDTHYLWMGRWATVAGIIISIAAAYVARSFNNIMEMLQLVFGFVNAPLLATFLLGMFWRRSTGHGAFFGLLGGTTGAAIFHGLSLEQGATAGFIKGGWLFGTTPTLPVLTFVWATFFCLFGTALVHVSRGDGATSRELGVRIGKLLLMVVSPALALFSMVIFCRPAEAFEFKSKMGQNFWIAIVAWTTCFVLTIVISLITKRTKTNEELAGLVYSLTPKQKSENEPWFKRPVTLGVIILVAAVVLNIIFR